MLRASLNNIPVNGGNFIELRKKSSNSISCLLLRNDLSSFLPLQVKEHLPA